MRLALYGNLANTAYIQARLLRRAGINAELVTDPLESFVMSDPRWEDLDLELRTDSLSIDSLPDAQPPSWVRNGPSIGTSRWARQGRIVAGAAGQPGAIFAAARTAGWRGAAYAGAYARVISQLRGYDCALVYGLGPIVSTLAGIPFLMQPFGGDITIVPFADGDGWQGQSQPGTRPSDGPQPHIAELQRYGLRCANRILVCDPNFDSYIERLGLTGKALQFGVPIDTDMYAPGDETDLRAQLLGDREGTLIFVPSRQDWYWKASNLMLEGFARAARDRTDVVLACAGWGIDLERSRQLIAELGIGPRVRLLEHAMSKPRLRRYYRAADIVMDQFFLGAYGGSSLEAMSCARPLLIYLNRDLFESRFPEFPPVINVRHPEEIGAALGRLIDDPGQREAIGRRARAWVIANHGPPLVQRAADLCSEAIAEGPQS
jgi:glycosyltransferase involved in cell wall biosynthesis